MSRAVGCGCSNSSSCSTPSINRSPRSHVPLIGPSSSGRNRAQHQVHAASRRDLAALLPATWLVCQGAAYAEEAAAVAPAADPSAASTSSSTSAGSAPSPVLQPFVDNEYELQFPSNYTYVETPIVRVERGPQPERSPVLGRFEAPNGEPGVITVLMRRSNALKQTLLQVNDISQLGNPIEVAQLILPRGSTLLATATQQVAVPPKQTPVGLVELPPQTYYRFEFTTPQGDHVAMSAAARRGSVYICGASMTAERWQQAGPIYGKVVKSFRIRTPATVA